MAGDYSCCVSGCPVCGPFIRSITWGPVPSPTDWLKTGPIQVQPAICVIEGHNFQPLPDSPNYPVKIYCTRCAETRDV